MAFERCLINRIIRCQNFCIFGFSQKQCTFSIKCQAQPRSMY